MSRSLTRHVEEQLWEAAAVHSDRRTFLDAVDAQRRRIRLKLVSDELLRKGETRAQKRRMQRLASDLRAQLSNQLRVLGRHAFRGQVAVEIDLRVVSIAQPPASPPAVKAYLDLLEGLAYADDSAVAYLRVTRHAGDNPWFWRTRGAYDLLYGSLPRIPHGPKNHVEVKIAIQPVRTYVADFDRVFDLRELVFEGDWDDRDEFGAEFFSQRFDHGPDDNRMDDLAEEERDYLAGRGIYASDGPFVLDTELRECLCQMRRAEMRALRAKLLLDVGLREIDRPGPPSLMTRLVWREDPRYQEWATREIVGPARFTLPLPPIRSGGPRWRETVRETMAAHHSGWRVLDALHGRAVALDIAVRGTDENPRDLDNLARDVVVPFEETFCSRQRGSVASYRVYTAEVGPPGVRTQVIGDERLESLERAIDSARNWLLARGPRFRGD